MRWKVEELRRLLLQKQIDEEKRILYADVAEATGLTLSLVGRYMKGDVLNPSIDAMARFARYFSKDLKYFIEEENEQGNCKATPNFEVALPA